MADRKTHVANFFETELTTELGPTDLVAEVLSTGGLQSPAFLVIEPDDPNQREVILFDGAFTDTQFRATSIANRYLGGSAQPGGLTHPAGSVVRSAPLAQHIQDLNDRIDADRLRIAPLEQAAAEGFYPPTGTIVAYAGASAPAGWLFCHGQAVSRTTYARLFAVIGTTYGAGDGSTTFNLPDLRQRFPLGKAVSGTGSTLGATGGAIDHTHSVPSHTHSMSHSHSMSHTHTVNPPNTSTTSNGGHYHNVSLWDSNVPVGGGSSASHSVRQAETSTTGTHTHNVDIPAFTSGGSSASNTGGSSASSTGSAGSGQTGSSNPPYLVVNYIIKT